MPFSSEAQRRFMWANHPDIADKWAHGEHSRKSNHRMPKKGGTRNLPYHVRRKSRSKRR